MTSKDKFYANENLPTYDEAVGGICYNTEENESNYIIGASQSNEFDQNYQNIITTATVKPFYQFKVNEDVLKIRMALESKDEDLLLQILCNRSAMQRNGVADMYLTVYRIIHCRTIFWVI